MSAWPSELALAIDATLEATERDLSRLRDFPQPSPEGQQLLATAARRIALVRAALATSVSHPIAAFKEPS
jgi:hypothetical protein